MAITQTITLHGSKILKIVEPGFTADAETGIVVDLHAAACKALFERFGYPKRIGLQGRHSAGATDVVDFVLQCSNVNADFGNALVQITDITDTAEVIVGDNSDVPPARFWQSLCNTVGAGNTVELTWILEF